MKFLSGRIVQALQNDWTIAIRYYTILRGKAVPSIENPD